MIWLTAGVALLLLGLWLTRRFAAADPVIMARWVRYTGAAALMALAFYLSVRGQALLAAPIAGWALLLLRKPADSPPGPDASRASGAGSARRNRHGMSQEEALQILGLKSGASQQAIREAHRRLMQTCHPDHGGSDYLAARINAAKDVLLS